MSQSERGSWISTFTGRQFYPLDPRPDDIHIEDIAHALSMQCRFTGHTRSFYSVAEHSCRVANAIFAAMKPGADRIVTCLWALLHDASEAYICDVARPIKNQPEMNAYRAAERRLEAVIAKRFELPPVMPPIVKEFDEILLITEARDLMAAFDNRWWHWEQREKALPEKIEPWSPGDAEATFLHLFQRSSDAWAKKREQIAQRPLETEKKMGSAMGEDKT